MRVLVTVTFNPNQLRAHLEPIADLPEVDEIVLVADRRPPPLPKLRAIVPPRLLSRFLGRALAKLVVCSVLALRLRPDWVVGFNLVPHGLNAILSSRLGGSRSAYVMIGGSTEWEGGGWSSDNKVLGRLRSRSRLLERALLSVARRATVTISMGTRARGALLAKGFDPARVVVIPASVDGSRFRPRRSTPTWDVIAVAELIPTKRLHDLVDAAALVVRDLPQLRVAVAGAGPLLEGLVERADRAGVGEHVEFLGFRADVPELYSSARLFVLPSANEGLSVSLLEAMASGLPAVVSDVGEARDLLEHGENGFLYPPGDVPELAHLLVMLLADPDLARRVGVRAMRDALAHAGRPAIAAAYRGVLTPVDS